MRTYENTRIMAPFRMVTVLKYLALANLNPHQDCAA